MSIIEQFFRTNGRKLIRYAGVSCAGVVFGQALLFFLHSVLDWRAVVANITAVAISTIPSYLLNRAWVWGKTGSHSAGAEVLPFWGMAFLGLILSIVLVGYAESRWDSAVMVQLANLSAFGSLWVAKFFVLDRVLFRMDKVVVSQHAETSV